MGKKGKQFISVLMILALLLGIFPTNVVWAAEQSDDVEKVLENPKVKTNSKMESGREVTWDCVWFGSYPQREVIPESLEGLYVLKNMWYEKDVSAIIDDEIYQKLQNADNWDANNEITLDGEKYCRISQDDAKQVKDYETPWYRWYSWEWTETEDCWHYFKYDPIKWRVLNTDDKHSEAFLLADVALDMQKYYDADYWDLTEDELVTNNWKKSDLRSWLNSKGSEERGFLNTAFSNKEQEAIINIVAEERVADKVSLLSENEVWESQTAIDYGFAEASDIADEARRSKSSTYAKIMGLNISVDQAAMDCNNWWIRPANGSTVQYDGQRQAWGDMISIVNLNAVRPVVKIDLSKTGQYRYAGTVSSGGKVKTECSLLQSYADYMYSERYPEFIYYATTSEQMSGEAEKTGTYNYAHAWKDMKDLHDILDNPANVADKVLSESDFYQGIIFALFEEATYNSKLTKITDVADTVGEIADAVKINIEKICQLNASGNKNIKDLTSKEIEAIKKLTEKQLEKSKLFQVSDTISDILTFIDYVKDIDEYLEYFENCVRILYMNESYKNVMQDMYDLCPVSDLQLKRALGDCVSVMKMSEEQFIKKMKVHAAAVAGKETTKTVAGQIWSAAKEMIMESNPYAGAVWVGWGTGIAVSDTLFNTSKIAEKVIDMRMICDIKKLVVKVFECESNKYNQDKEGTDYTAGNFAAAVDVCYRYIDSDAQCSYDFVQAVDDAMISKIIQFFKGNERQAVKDEIETVQKKYKSLHRSNFNDWVEKCLVSYPKIYKKYKDEGKGGIFDIIKWYSIKCPVDVYVYDEKDNLVASVIGNRVFCKEGADLTVMCVDDQKMLYFYDSDNSYKIKYAATDAGTMDIDIKEFKEEKATRTVKYVNVPLEKDLVYTSQEDMKTGEEESYQLNGEENGDIIKPIADTANNTRKYTLSVTGGYIYDETVKRSEQYCPGEKVTVYATASDDYTFNRWSANVFEANISDITARKITFIMPESDVELTATSTKKPDSKPTVPDNSDSKPTVPDNSNSKPTVPGTSGSKAPVKNTVHKVKGLKYKITKSSASNGTVTVTENLKKNATKITIPSTVKIKGYTFKVKGINKKVFQKCKKLRKVKIGAYVTNIGSRCFYKCSNLSSVTFSGKKAPKIENQAFKKTRAKAKRTKAMSNKQFNLLKKRVNNAKW